MPKEFRKKYLSPKTQQFWGEKEERNLIASKYVDVNCQIQKK